MNETNTPDQLTIEPTKAPVPVYSLAQLNELCRRKMRIEINYSGTNLAIECLQLTPAQDAVLADIVDVVTPPITRGKAPEEDRPDWTNPKYLKEKSAAELQARALGLYWCVPMFKESNPNLTDAREILLFIQGQADPAILEAVWNGIRKGGLRLAELVNFS